MDAAMECLQSNVQEIAGGAIEQTDLDLLEPAVREIVRDLPRAIAEERPLDVTPLQDTGTDAQLIARVLRAILTEAIGALARSCTGDALAEAVLALREAIRLALPKVHPDPRCEPLRRAMNRGRVNPTAEDRGQVCAFFQGILDTTHELVYAHDVNGMLLYVNDPGLRVLRYARDDLYDGMSIYDFVVPEYLDLVETRLESPGAMVRSPYSIEVYAQDGSRVLLEIDTRPLFDDDGDVVAIIGLARDLALERRLQKEISRSYADLESLFETLPVGVLMTEPDGRISNANPTAVSLCGASNVNALIGQNVKEIFGTGHEDAVAAIDTAIGDRTPLRRRCLGKTRFGATLRCDLVVQPMLEAAGEFSGFIVLIIDVSEQLYLQRNLLRTEKLSAVGEMVAGAAHELNNPLTGILGYTQFLLGSIKDAGIHEKLDRVAQEAQRCKRIVENLLNFARYEETEKAPCDVNQVLSDTLALREYQLRVDDIELVVELAEDLPELMLSANEIRQVFLNVISNAQHALGAVTDRARRLRIATLKRADFVRVVFEDNGPGIPLETQSKVFDPFFTTKRLGEGTGLGLSVSYGIVKDHGGEVLLESEEEKGTTLTVLLPMG